MVSVLNVELNCLLLVTILLQQRINIDICFACLIVIKHAKPFKMYNLRLAPLLLYTVQISLSL